MIAALQRALAQWMRNQRFATISRQLEDIYATRRGCDLLEKQLHREYQRLSLADANANITARRAVR